MGFALMAAAIVGGGIVIGAVSIPGISSLHQRAALALLGLAPVCLKWFGPKAKLATASSLILAIVVFVVGELFLSPPQFVKGLAPKPGQIRRGETITLNWRVVGARSVKLISESTGSGLSQGWHDVSGKDQQAITPESEGKKVYRLRATCWFRSQEQAATVQVSRPPPPPEPMIDDFSANPRQIEYGDSVLLTWKTRNADTIELLASGPGHGLPADTVSVDASGQKEIHPAAVGVYTYRLRTFGGNRRPPPTQRQSVRVREPVMIKFDSVKFSTGRDNKNADTILMVRIVDEQNVLYASYAQDGLLQFPKHGSITVPLTAPTKIRAKDLPRLRIEISIQPKWLDEWFFGFTLNATKSDGVPCPMVQPGQRLSQDRRALLLNLKPCP